MFLTEIRHTQHLLLAIVFIYSVPGADAEVTTTTSYPERPSGLCLGQPRDSRSTHTNQFPEPLNAPSFFFSPHPLSAPTFSILVLDIRGCQPSPPLPNTNKEIPDSTTRRIGDNPIHLIDHPSRSHKSNISHIHIHIFTFT
ncbi:uncharacterized protein BCR38DRAFT_24662 [Pseudomassariella vexata]|uniref:Secreted protein n=1 Tax=Pseudomassariella vexata TaxID=1141098 RepID=A0A1Y2EMB6_9PEZI|nr:uncharacterized protein BCR38DRAFT_24662 [Pseudomassariella vexata]ORY71975.1 hypothetical protein BCR38DRAFT_24662 [Pseudomassariella vexata]